MQQRNSTLSFLSSWPVALAISVGFLFRLHEVVTEELEPDELHQWFVATSSPEISSIFSDFISSSGTPHPSASFILMWFWTRIAGDSVIMMRIPSFLFGMLTIVFCGLLAKDWFGERAGQHAAVLSAVISDFIHVSAQARMYSMLVFLSVLFVWCCNRTLIARDSTETRDMALLATVAVLLSHTHYFGTMLAFGGIFFAFLSDYAKHKKWGNHPSTLLTILLLCYLPHLPYLLTHLGGRGASYIEQYVSWDIAIIVLSRQLNGSILISILAIAFLIFSLFRNWGNMGDSEKTAWFVLLLWWVGSVSVALSISLIGPAIVSPANLRITLPATAIALSACTSRFCDEFVPTKPQSPFPVIMGSLVILHLVFFHGILDHSNPELETAFSEAGAQTSGEQVVLLVNAHGLAWPSENGECRLCWHIEGEIIDTVLVYGADGDIDELQKSSEQGTLLMVVELEHWVEGYSDSQNSEINSLGEVIWSGEYYHANTRLVKL